MPPVAIEALPASPLERFAGDGGRGCSPRSRFSRR
jgi:hypothetical protein